MSAGSIQVHRGAFDVGSLVGTFGPLLAAPGWEPGRQGTGYAKLPLADRALPWLDRALVLLEPPGPGLFDAWLLRYEVGDHVPTHVDPPLGPGLAHWRLNVVVAQGEGGELVADGRIVPLSPGDAVLFRPDVVPHAVTAVRAGARLVWSLGTNRIA